MNILQRDEEVKRAILDAAKRVFQKWGMGKTTMEDIAQEAGKGKSTLYNYFESKEEIFESLMMEELANVIRASKLAAGSANTAKDKLKAYMRTVIVEMRKTEGVNPLLLGELKGKKEFIKRVVEKMGRYEQMIVLDILEQGIKAGEFKRINESNKVKAAEVVVGIVRGLQMYLFFELDDAEKLELASWFLTDGI